MTRPLLPRHTSGICLRRLIVSDLPAFQAYRHDPAVGRYQGWAPQSDADAAAFLASMQQAPLFEPGEWCQLAIADSQTNALLGDIGVCLAEDGREAEIGFSLAAGAQGRGLGRAAIGELIALLFEATDIAQIIAITDARNLASIRLLTRLGFQQRDVMHTQFRGEPCVEYRYGLPRPIAHPTVA